MNNDAYAHTGRGVLAVAEPCDEAVGRWVAFPKAPYVRMSPAALGSGVRIGAGSTNLTRQAPASQRRSERGDVAEMNGCMTHL
jgi:hypothetical protein